VSKIVFSSDAAYFVSYGEKPNKEVFESISIGLSIIQYEKNDEPLNQKKFLGHLNWYDKLEERSRTVRISNLIEKTDQTVKIVDEVGIQYIFNYLTAQFLDKARKYLSELPEQAQTAEIQEIIKS
jgi:hypothetical protein